MFLVKATECLVGLGCGFNDVGGSDAGFTTVAGRMQVYDDCRSDAGFGTMASPVHESLTTTGRSGP